ncbi:helix-turn-helix domain-containing protein [Faecalibacter rhinopitheci]|uniref:Helix-turn-helix transcriptional regulator n=1 Tax=Faecalibacter rhinopitheci TaxID=2779678 RepID=A0A8J7FT13_9FLAO|nr:helix-turn-helix transcriptional regulator [Faecalibacter rhinopitheci]MBF0598380.1 helix-turn-helix transcriptional regulator [Faecalibacter rhinopitheci]
MNHNIDRYIKHNLNKFNWKDNKLAEKSGLSASQISKLKNGHVSKLSAQTFYSIVIAFDDTLDNAIKMVFDLNTFNLKKYIPRKRNEFGLLLQQFEISKNSLEEISQRTGIKEIRLSEAYYRNGALDAHEILLIEKVIGLEAGYLFKLMFEKKGLDK